MSYFSYLYVSCSRSITSVWEERESLFVCYHLLVIMLFLGAWDELRRFIVALPGPSI